MVARTHHEVYSDAETIQVILKKAVLPLVYDQKGKLKDTPGLEGKRAPQGSSSELSLSSCFPDHPDIVTDFTFNAGSNINGAFKSRYRCSPDSRLTLGSG